MFSAPTHTLPLLALIRCSELVVGQLPATKQAAGEVLSPCMGLLE